MMDVSSCMPAGAAFALFACSKTSPEDDEAVIVTLPAAACHGDLSWVDAAG
jgi:hypothetical protein